MTPARILTFPVRGGRDVAPIARVGAEPVSPFRHLMPPQRLTPRQILHRRRMMTVLWGGYRLTPARQPGGAGV